MKFSHLQIIGGEKVKLLYRPLTVPGIISNFSFLHDIFGEISKLCSKLFANLCRKYIQSNLESSLRLDPNAPLPNIQDFVQSFSLPVA